MPKPLTIYRGKKVLVTGGTGLIGQPVVQMLLDNGANVRVASLDDPSRVNPNAEFKRGNLMDGEFCKQIVTGMDYVFHLAGIKGSVSLGKKRAASFFVPHILMNTLMMESAYRANVERYLYTSSVGVYPPAEVFYEDDAWKAPPYEGDKFPGWAKRMGELQAEAYKIEYGWDKIAIIRPTNIFGPFDNFDPQTAMVVPALIARVASGENPLVVWGDGTPIRDFLYSRDCAEGMLLALEHGANCTPINLGGGHRTSIGQIAKMIGNSFPNPPKIEFDPSKPGGQPLRVLDISRAKEMLGFAPRVSVEQGIRETVEWYLANKTEGEKRYNVFYQKSFLNT
jgi:GDP-L-fucose synthase